MEFRLLGSVEASAGGRPVEVGHARQQCVLVALLVDANTVVSVDQLVDRVWGDWPPLRARGTLSTYLTRLRRVLDGPRIVRRPGGYVLTVDEHAVDLHRFRRLVARARSAADDHAALALWEEALGLWRGEPFAGLDNPWLATVRVGWERERQAAELEHADAALRCGRHAELLTTLTARAEQRPLDERLAGQLMVALYRSGRQVDALAHFRALRTRLSEELGTDPGPPLCQLHQQILAADPALNLPTDPPTPRQLPPVPRPFVGRERELATLTETLRDRIAAVVGIGGIGKTWLALRWAYEHAGEFPDGQLYVDLRGFDPTASPVPASVAVRGFLDALGVVPAAVPADEDAQVALYRSLVAGRRMLVMIDNARDTTQVVPLLPGGTSATVLVTSRRDLGGLVSAHGARVLRLDVFTDAEARELLTGHVGADRVAAEPAAVDELVTCCAGLPLAIGITAARAGNHPHFPLSALAGKLHDRRLDALDAGEPHASLRSVFSWTYDALSPDAAELFGLLGLAPGQDISLAAATSLAAAPAGPLLRELETAHLVRQTVPDRYRMHDLVRLYAAEKGGHSPAALRRLIDHYLHTVRTADRLLNSHRPVITIDAPVPGCRPEPLDTVPAALAWLAAEHANLLAAQRFAFAEDWHAAVWGLAWYVRTFLWRHGYLRDNLATWQLGLRAANQLGDASVRCLALRHTGDAHLLLRHFTTALVYHYCALTVATGDPAHLGHCHWGIWWGYGLQGNHRRALPHAHEALRLYERADDQPWRVADALNAIGWSHAWLGDYEQTRTYCERALMIFRAHGHRNGEVRALNSLGLAAHGTGRFVEAVGHFQRSLALIRELGHTYDEAETLDRLAETYTALGRHDEARAAWQRAEVLYRSQHRTAEAEHVAHRLGDRP